MTRRLTLVLAAVASLGALTGCQGLYGVSLPGAVGANGYQVTAYFHNVNQLVPDAAVKVADVTVGTVSNISLVTRTMQAKVVMHIERSVHLPANTVAILEETSLLGEKFVELGPPPGVQPVGQLPTNGRAVLAVGDTVDYPNLEDVFGVLSTVLNGGGLQNLETINDELVHALQGRESTVRNLFGQLRTFIGGLNTQRTAIVAAIQQLNRLSGTFAAQTQTISTALQDLGPGIGVLASERTQLVSLLSALSNLGSVSTRIINASEQNTVADLSDLKPILSQIVSAGSALPNDLELLFDYPFPHTSVYGVPGDYTNLYATLDLNSLCNIPSIVSANLSQLSGLCPLPQVPGNGGAPRIGQHTTKTTKPGLLKKLGQTVNGVQQGLAGLLGGLL
jgi:phospholipid/cholesterol/gamma-HCH transport system substrate-binding protein